MDSMESIGQSTDPNERDALPTRTLDASRINQNENFFQFPSDKREAGPTLHHHLLQEYNECERALNESFQKQFQNIHTETEGDSTESSLLHKDVVEQESEKNYENFLKDLKRRSMAIGSLELSTDEAIKELSSLYSILDELSTIEETLNKRRLCLIYAKSLSEHIKKSEEKIKCSQLSDHGMQLEQSVALSDERWTSDVSSPTKQPPCTIKQQRERSKSVIADDISVYDREKKLQEDLSIPSHILRRQNSYSEGKSKVSKWTKVKAAFKWERANVPVLSEGNKSEDSVQHGIGLVPNNFEVARYLRVPSRICGGTSSVDSILSSSSGHILSEVPTSGTLSSASSVDDIKGIQNHNPLRRDSTQSDVKSCSPHAMDYINPKESTDTEVPNIANGISLQSKPCCNKSLRKSKLINDFEVLPENVVANIKSTSRKIKLPPSPLNLNPKQDLNDLEEYYMIQQLKSPKGPRQTCIHNNRILSSPANSSVPSSPSRLSDFFAELESEELSSGDFSDPTTPNHTHPRNMYQHKQDEIHKKYEMLRKKLDLEFEAKQRKWEKSKANPNACRVSAYKIVKSPTVEIMQTHNVNNISAKLLEESLSPDFKKKLQKWRVKKQESLCGNSPTQFTQPPSPNRDGTTEVKTKIDWNLWKSGQIKLEGQGLSPLPYEKDLPEEFQKKLEQWQKIKKSSSMFCTSDGWKRTTKHNESTKRANNDDEKKAERSKFNEKDKLEKLSKLKAIVADHPSKEIEVKTSAGVMKFEGISRKFTRKLYEWEKARGIGPESSTFALLHPGYCPLVVGRISKECHNNGNSPTLSRSFSLDSMTPNTAFSTISKQASSLSLNDVGELKEMEVISSNDALEDDVEFKNYDEPEAVIVEVEDHIVETASPLITCESVIEQQTAVSKYEEDTCNDYCKTRHIQSFESCSNSEHMLAVLKRSQEQLDGFSTTITNMSHKEEFLLCQSALVLVRSIYPYFKGQLTKHHVLNAVADVESQIDYFSDLHQRIPLDEACCQEIMEERYSEYSETFRELKKSLDKLCLTIQDKGNNRVMETVPDINIISEDGLDSSSIYATIDYGKNRDLLSTTLEATDENSISLVEDALDTKVTINRSFSNSTATGCKKKLRSRKLGSRQNSKTESSDSSEEDMPETPRRWKRKNYRVKQRSYDEDPKKSIEEFATLGEPCPNDDLVYMLKVKPGMLIGQCDYNYGAEPQYSRVLISSNESCIQLLPMETPTALEAVLIDSNGNSNVFVKTRRKIFRTIEEPNGRCGIAFIEQDLDSIPHAEDVVSGSTNVVCSENERNETYSQQSIETHEDDLTESGPQQDVVLASTNGILSENKRSETISVHPIEKLEDDLTESGSKQDQHHVAEISHKLPIAADSQFRKQLPQKSWSFHDIREQECYDIEKSHSLDSFVTRYKFEGNPRSPLATDSLRVIHNNLTFRVLKYSSLANKREKAHITSENHFSKHNENKIANSLKKPKSAVLKKIETKYAKIHSTTPFTQKSHLLSAEDKKENIIPIVLKYMDRTSIEPTKNSLDSPGSTNSEPTTPLFESSTKLLIPLSDRAQRLQKAKQDFLKNTLMAAKLKEEPGSEVEHNETLEHLLSSTTNQAAYSRTGSIYAKNSSVDSLNATQLTHPDADAEYAAYESSSSRVQSRSAKISSKLSFVSLASKLLRVRGKQEKKLTDGMRVLPQGTATPPEEILQKSKSSIAVIGRTNDKSQRPAQALNKSQSDQYVLQQKINFI